MSQDVFELLKGMDMKAVETQIALQCAPMIAGLKISNLLISQRQNLCAIERILKNAGASYLILLKTKEKVTFLLYDEEALKAFLAEEDHTAMLREFGYVSMNFQEILAEFQMRYESYTAGKQSFPHEMGLLLGYPTEDVEGFIKNEGKNFLYAGYWKVYGNISAKVQLFRRFELAKKTMLQMILAGVRVEEVFKIYSREALAKAAV